MNYQKVQMCILVLLVAYGIANMAGVNVPAANVPAVNRIIDVLFILLAADQLRGRIQQADGAVPPDPTGDEIKN